MHKTGNTYSNLATNNGITAYETFMSPVKFLFFAKEQNKTFLNIWQ